MSVLAACAIVVVLLVFVYVGHRMSAFDYARKEYGAILRGRSRRKGK